MNRRPGIYTALVTAERAIVGGCVMFGRTSLNNAEDMGLEAGHFSDPRSALVWETMAHMVGEIGLLTVTDALEAAGKKKIVGIEWLTVVSDDVMNIGPGMMPTVMLVVRAHERRALQATLRDMLEDAANPSIEVAVTRARALSRLVDASSSTVLVGPMQAAEDLARRVRDVANGDAKPVPTGLIALDTMLGGGLGDPFQHTFVGVLGRPGSGKSAFVQTIMCKLGLPDVSARPEVRPPTVPVLMHSLEQGNHDVMLRGMAISAGVQTGRIRRGRATEDDYRGLVTALSRWSEGSIWLGLEAGATLDKIYSETMRWWERVSRPGRDGSPGADRAVVMLDYLELPAIDTSIRRDLALGMVSMMMLNLAKATNGAIIPILLSQLNRDVEKRKNKRPVMSDIRECGKLEQDCSILLGLYRDEYYRKQTGVNIPEAIEGMGEVSIIKNRGGETGIVVLGFDGPRTRWHDVSPARSDAYRAATLD